MKARRLISFMLACYALYCCIRVVTRARTGTCGAPAKVFAIGDDHDDTGGSDGVHCGTVGNSTKSQTVGNVSNGVWPQWVYQLLVAKAQADEAAAKAAEAEEVADEVDAAVAGTLEKRNRQTSIQRRVLSKVGAQRFGQRIRVIGNSSSSTGSSSNNIRGNHTPSRRFRRLSVSDDCSDSFERHHYIQDKLLVDEASLRSATPPSSISIGLFAGVKIAFLFIVMDKLEFEAVWNRFFAGAPVGQYSIYVHFAAPEKNRNSTVGVVPLSRWGAVQVPWAPNTWCALMGAEVSLLMESLRDPQTQQFVFVSHNTIPLKSFGYVYQQLGVAAPTTSKFCFAEPAHHRTATAETVAQELKRQCIFRDFYRALNPRTLKHHQWVVLSRDHATAVVRHGYAALHIWKQSWEMAAPDIANMGEGCSDEAVPIVALLHGIQEEGRSTGNTWADLTRLGVEQQCLTFVHWRNCFGNTDLDLRQPVKDELITLLENWDLRMLTDKDFNFFQSALKRELNGYPSIILNMSATYLSRLTQHGFMFARKLAPNLLVEVDGGRAALEDVLPTLWAAVDEKQAARLVWTRLETDGKPTAI